MSQDKQSQGSSCELINPFKIVQQKIDAICERMKVDEKYRLRLGNVSGSSPYISR